MHRISSNANQMQCSLSPHKATNHNGWFGAAAFKGSDTVASFLTVENSRLLDES